MSLQASADRPWLIRAAYFLTENDMKILKLPGSELSSRSNPVYFSRLFLSKWLGGSQHPAYATVKFNQNRAYHLAAYYFGKQDWNPQYPKRTGENGALLVVGKSHEEPPVPWRTTGEASPVGHRAILKPINCFVKRSPAEYKYIGCYVIHDEFRKLTEKDVEQHVPRATRDLWINGIDTSQWGAKVKGKQEVKKAEELFKLPDDNPHKLCFYWQYLEYIGYDQGLYNALCAKGEEVGWTTRKPILSEGLTMTEGMAEESTTMKMAYTKLSTAPFSDDDEPKVKKE